jgi:hypothetical protein
MHQSRSPRVLRIGAFGGTGGQAFDVCQGDTPTRLKSINLRYYGVIDAIEFTYINQSGQERTIRCGGTGGTALPQPVSENLYSTRCFNSLLPR